MSECEHDKRFSGVFDMPREDHGCVACGFERVSAEIGRAKKVVDAAREAFYLNGYHDGPCFCANCALRAVLMEYDAAADAQTEPCQHKYVDDSESVSFEHCMYCGQSEPSRVADRQDLHDSDCATHNMPAYPNGPCDCTQSEKGSDE